MFAHSGAKLEVKILEKVALITEKKAVWNIGVSFFANLSQIW